MKDISEIEDEYKTSFENLIERYRSDLKESKEKKVLREKFNLSLKKIISKRNKDMSRYIKKNKKKILGLPERKKKKYKKVNPYKMYEFSFEPTFWERCLKILSIIWFYIKIYSRWLYHNFVPSFLKRSFFKIKFWLGSIFYDFKVYMNHRFGNTIAFLKKIFASIKKFFVFIFGKVFMVFKKISEKVKEFKKKRAEKKKAKKEEKEKAEKEAKEEAREDLDNEVNSNSEEESQKVEKKKEGKKLEDKSDSG